MKTRTLFFTLFTSISILLMAQGFAFAGPKFIVKDTNGDEVGTIVTIFNDIRFFVTGPGTPPQADKRSILTRVEFFIGVDESDTVSLGLTVDNASIQFQNRVLYQTVNCTEPVFMPEVLAEADFGPAFTPSAVVGINGPGGERSLYVAVAETAVTRTFNSGSVDGNCTTMNFPINRLSVPALLLDPDLHTTFPPGYTMELIKGKNIP